jgi:hypothetical protein
MASRYKISKSVVPGLKLYRKMERGGWDFQELKPGDDCFHIGTDDGTERICPSQTEAEAEVIRLEQGDRVSDRAEQLVQEFIEPMLGRLAVQLRAEFPGAASLDENKCPLDARHTDRLLREIIQNEHFSVLPKIPGRSP